MEAWFCLTVLYIWNMDNRHVKKYLLGLNLSDSMLILTFSGIRRISIESIDIPIFHNICIFS